MPRASARHHPCLRTFCRKPWVRLPSKKRSRKKDFSTGSPTSCRTPTPHRATAPVPPVHPRHWHPTPRRRPLHHPHPCSAARTGALTPRGHARFPTQPCRWIRPSCCRSSRSKWTASPPFLCPRASTPSLSSLLAMLAWTPVFLNAPRQLRHWPTVPLLMRPLLELLGRRIRCLLEKQWTTSVLKMVMLTVGTPSQRRLTSRQMLLLFLHPRATN